MKPFSVAVPGSKSITNRALICAAFAKGKTILSGALISDDTRYMIEALRSLGIKIEQRGEKLIVHGGRLRAPTKKIYCGNAGTVMRFLAAVCGTQVFEVVLDGDARMRRRPIQDLLDALRALGVQAESLSQNGCPPIRIRGPMKNSHTTIRGEISSQFLSGLLLAAPLAGKKLTLRVEGPLVSRGYIDTTLGVMEEFGVKVSRRGYRTFSFLGREKYRARTYHVEGDASAASYFWGISALTGQPITISNVPTSSMQADIVSKKYIENYTRLKNLNCVNFPDSAMTLAALASYAPGRTRLTGLSNLRVKECDRLDALTTELSRIGVRVRELSDGLEIHGDPSKITPAHIRTYDDHRMAMCFGMLGFVTPGMTFDNLSCVSKTYPRFWQELARLKKEFRAKNIVLTGMRGTGKSKLGRLLAAKLGRKFIDTDEVITRDAGLPIAEIVRSRGWRYFRTLEKKAVQKIAGRRGVVIATGGGTLISPANTRLLKKNGVVILLDTSVKVLRSRLAGATNRPRLTQGKDFLHELDDVYAARKNRYYDVSDVRLDVSLQTKNKQRDIEQKVATLYSLVARLGII